MEPILKIENISKNFGNVEALKNVDFIAETGKVNVLIGENGAGKSTLMKIIGGVHRQSSGRMIYNGKEVEFKSPIEAQDAGIGTVYQELTLLPDLSVGENLFPGKSLPVNKFQKVQWDKVYAQARKLIKEYLDMDIDPRMKVGKLGTGIQQMIEIVRVLNKDIKLIIMDEPTASLTEREVNCLFGIIERLKEKGITIIYISHRINEIFEVGDNITVLRDGEGVGKVLVNEVKYDDLIKMMVGRDLVNFFPKEDFSHIEKRETLRVENLTRDRVFEDISFTAKTGEILGFAGLMGAGRTEIARAIFGADKLSSGKIFIDGKQVTIDCPIEAIQNGIALIPEDRKTQGLIIKHTIRENIAITNLNKLSNNLGIMKKNKEKKVCNNYADNLRIVTPSIQQCVNALSGGNQQKVVIAKWACADSNIVIFDEPTRGIDVGAKVEVYNTINKMVLEGKTVIIISSELLELIGVCDRIITIKEGRITGEISGQTDQETVLKYMLGEGEAMHCENFKQ